MKLTAKMKLTGVAAATALSMAPAQADIELSPNFSVSGYIAGDFKFVDTDDGDDTTLDMAATKFAVMPKFDAVSGKVSVYAGSDQDPVLLDTYFTYDLGGGTSITAGNFLSYLGYEAFDVVNLSTLTYSNDVPTDWAAIPAYHTGIRIDHSVEGLSLGLAVTDSELGDVYYEGDGSAEDGVGIEAIVSYTKDKFTGFAGLGYESYDPEGGYEFDYLTLDFWGQVSLTDAFSVAGEVCFTQFDEKFTGGEGGTESSDSDAYFWALYGIFNPSDATTLIARISGGEQDSPAYGDVEFLKFTGAAVFAVTPNLDVKAELTFTDYDGGGDATFFGVRGIFKF